MPETSEIISLHIGIGFHFKADKRTSSIVDKYGIDLKFTSGVAPVPQRKTRLSPFGLRREFVHHKRFNQPTKQRRRWISIETSSPRCKPNVDSVDLRMRA